MGNNTQIGYQKRIVAFLDVLGFKNFLKEFEEEANKNSSTKNDDEKHFISYGANKFIEVFKDVIRLIASTDCNYYLFSDNICITIDPTTNKELAIDLLFTVSDLFRRFSEMGYFLRGGIDYGWMLDEKDIAMGLPLANAYLIENSVANFPRIIISENYKNFLDEICKFEEVGDNYIFSKENFLVASCEITYLNPFYNVVKTDDKISFFSIYKKAIERGMTENMKMERIYHKFKWLAEEFNRFLDLYLNNIDTIEQEREIYQEEIEEMKSLIIKDYAK